MTGRGRPAKTLDEHVEDGSFRAREHEHLLETPLAPGLGRDLRAIAARYRRARRPQTRRRIALEFERAVRLVD